MNSTVRTLNKMLVDENRQMKQNFGNIHFEFGLRDCKMKEHILNIYSFVYGKIKGKCIGITNTKMILMTKQRVEAVVQVSAPTQY